MQDKFMVKISLTNVHLFYNYLVRLSVGNSLASFGRTYPCCESDTLCGCERIPLPGYCRELVNIHDR